MLPFVWSDECLRHEPGAEIWIGVRTPATELPERALRIREALLAAGAREVPAAAHPPAGPAGGWRTGVAHQPPLGQSSSTMVISIEIS